VVKTLYDFAGSEEGELRLNRGDLVKVYDNSTFKDWWKGECRGSVGIFPSNYVEMTSEEPGSATGPSAFVGGGGGGGGSNTSESDLVSKSSQIDKFTNILASIDPSRTNPSDHAELQVLLFYGGI
jgi:signal transducing adaptor molecule